MTAIETSIPHAPELRRALGFGDLVVYGLAYIAPFAPLTTIGFVWQASDGLIALAYLLGGVCMYFTAKSYAIMTERVPTAGSVYGFARYALGTFPGFLAGWMILLDYLLIPAFVYVLVAVAAGTLVPGLDRGVIVVAVAAFTLTVNWFGITVTSRANFTAVALQVILLVGLLGFALVALHGGKGNGALTLAPFYSPGRFNLGSAFAGTSICIMSFLGFDAISTLAEEVRGNDRRLIGRAIIATLVLSAVFFLLVAWILGNLMPGLAIGDPAEAPYALARWAVGAWAALVLAWAQVLVVGLSNALPMQVGVARVLFAMGRDRQLPGALGRVHPRYRTPHVAMLVSSAISLAIALVMRNRMDDLASIVNFGALSGFLVLHVSVLALFARRERSREWFTHWIVPVAGIAVVLAVFFGMSPMALKVGCTWLAGGTIYGWILHAKRRDVLHAQL